MTLTADKELGHIEDANAEVARCLGVRADELDPQTKLSSLSKYQVARLLAPLSENTQSSSLDLLDSIQTLGDAIEWIAVRNRNNGTIVLPDVEAGSSSLIRLRSVRPSDLEQIYSRIADPAVANRWRFRGQVPSVEHFAATFGDDVLVQFIAEDLSEGGAVSLNVLYGFDPLLGICYFGLLGLDSSADLLPMRRIHGSVLTLAYGFTRWPVRKVFLEIPEFNRSVVEGLPPDICREEGRLKDFYFHEGRPCDKYIFGISRESFFSGLSDYFPDAADRR